MDPNLVTLLQAVLSYLIGLKFQGHHTVLALHLNGMIDVVSLEPRLALQFR